MEPLINGSINPSWILTGVVTIMIFLLWRMLSTMQSEIKENAEKINTLNTIVQIHEEKHETTERNVSKIAQSNEKLADDIIAKLRAARL
jgi:predicted negative regulator of RcsB-dependent stress response